MRAATVATFLIAGLTTSPRQLDGKQSSPPLSLNGVLKLGASYQFSLLLDGTGMSGWRTLGRSFHHYTLEQYDESAKSLTVLDSEGNRHSIALEQQDNLPILTLSNPEQSTTATNQSAAPAESIHSIKSRLEIPVRPRSSSKSKATIASTSHRPRGGVTAGASPTVINSDNQSTEAENGNSEAPQENNEEPETLPDDIYQKLIQWEKHHMPLREFPSDAQVEFQVTPR